MDNSSNMAVNTTPTANQINPEHHYGLDKNKACLNNSCPSNTADIGCYIPAIDEIMRHNQGAPSVAHPNMTEKVQKSNDNITTVLCEHKSEDESPLIFSWEQTQLFRKQAIF